MGGCGGSGVVLEVHSIRQCLCRGDVVLVSETVGAGQCVGVAGAGDGDTSKKAYEEADGRTYEDRASEANGRVKYTHGCTSQHTYRHGEQYTLSPTVRREPRWIFSVDGIVVRIAEQVRVATREPNGVFVHKSAGTRVEVSGPHIVQSAPVLHDPPCPDKAKRVCKSLAYKQRFSKRRPGIVVHVVAGRIRDPSSRAEGVKVVIRVACGGIRPARQAETMHVLAHQPAAAILGHNVHQARRVEQVLGAFTVVDHSGPVPKYVVFIGPNTIGRYHGNQTILDVVGIGGQDAVPLDGDEITVRVVSIRGIAHGFVLVHVVCGVRRRDTVDDGANAVSGSIVVVDKILVGQQGGIFGVEECMDQLAGRIVLVGPSPIERAHARSPPHTVVGVIETRVDGAIRREVHQVQELACCVVFVGTVGSVS